MKKHLIAAAALATLSTAAFAQSATVYGFIDAGVMTSNNGNASGQSVTQATSGQWFPSMWGVTGSEDLGGGLKANFNLQSSLTNQTGGSGTSAFATTNAATALFDRYATVGLSGNFGKVELGKQLDILFLQSFVNGVIPTHSNSLAVNGLYTYGAPGAWNSTYGVANGATNTNTNQSSLGSRIQNAIAYSTPEVQGLKGTVQYMVGGVANSTTANSGIAGLLNYAVSGVNLSAAYEVVNGPTATNDGKTYSKGLIGAKTSIDKIDLAAQYHVYKAKAANTVNVNAYEAGVAYHLASNITVGVNYEYFDDKVNNKTPQITSLKAKYDFSKRTYAYGMAASYNTDAAGLMLQGYGDFLGKAKTTTSLAVGVVHGF